MKLTTIITLLIIIFILLFSAVVIFFWDRTDDNLNLEIAECISDNTHLYTQKGCSHCEIQLEKFGIYESLLNITDCFYELENCQGITNLPTWKIGNDSYVGVKSIKELRILTGC